jgi:hypothetical protein
VCHKSTYFIFRGNIYEHIEGVAMGSPLSPIVDEIYMEWFEKKAIETYPLKPKLWKRFVDDTYVVWPHGRDYLYKFKDHMS